MLHPSTHLSIQESCMRNIREDLRHYYKLLTGYFHSERSPHTSLLLSLKELMEVTSAQFSFVSLGDATVLAGCLCFVFLIVAELLYLVWGRQLDYGKGKLLHLLDKAVHYTCVSSSCESLFSCSTLKAAPEHLRSYGDRLRLCKVLSGFRVRTITISRAIAYMSSGESMQWLFKKIFAAMEFSITMMRETVFISNQFMTDAYICNICRFIYFGYLFPRTCTLNTK